MATIEYLCFPSNAGLHFSSNCLELVATENISSHKLEHKLLIYLRLSIIVYIYYTFMAQKFYLIILQWTEETLFKHCANMSYM